ncbi:MAG: FAD binding domain-containing protein, partial [Myxococcales bacterium]|nr:FAD binding domain-containing protein [Myxococcales bacterium]
ASPLVRNRATLGGNVGNASPIGDAPPILLSLEAELRLASARGTRRLPISEFFRGYRETALEPGEVIVSILLPSAVPTLSRFYKVSKRVLDDISTVAAAFALHLDTEGRIERARLAYGGVAATPKRAMEAEAALIGLPWGVEAVDAARPLLEAAFQPLDDHRGSAAYRKEMVVRLFEKFESETREGGR